MTHTKEAYEQNYQQFRSLNQIMWQIPVLAMTLTGGLWFGVSRISDNPRLVAVLLITATVGNFALSLVLYRFRHVMGCYLEWLKSADPDSFVDAGVPMKNPNRLEKLLKLDRLCMKDKIVHYMFQVMLWCSLLFSLFILVGFLSDGSGGSLQKNENPSLAYYDQHAVSLADNYESVAFEDVFPNLAKQLSASERKLNVLDIGSGSGRDAAWISSHGHKVSAIEPSGAMLKLAKQLHSDASVQWLQGNLPELSGLNLSSKTYDLVLLNAVWMHIMPSERSASLQKIGELLKSGGMAHVSLRLGPASLERGMFAISGADFVRDAMEAGFEVEHLEDSKDLLGRAEVSWRTYELRKSN